MLVSTVGSQMQLTAVNWHVFELLRGSTYTLHLFGGEFALSGEALGLGTLGLVRVIPIVLFALIGGVLADTLDRRRPPPPEPPRRWWPRRALQRRREQPASGRSGGCHRRTGR